MIDSNKIKIWLKKNNIQSSENVNLKNYSYFKSGGYAKKILYPNNLIHFQKCIKFLNKNFIKFKVIGETTNLIFLDDVVYSCFISTSYLDKIFFNENSNEIIAETGAMLPELSRYALKKSLTGFEGLEGIPGSIGAAVFMNAGAYGNEIKQTIVTVEVILPDGSIKKYNKSQLNLEHRNSIFRTKKNNEIIYKCFFKGKNGNALKIYNKMSLFHNKRHKYQEWMYPNLGSLYSGSVYRSLAKKDFIFGLISSFYYLIFYKWKLFRRESPDNRNWLNKIAVKRFNIKFKNQPFSNKDMNTLINNGHHTDEILDYISQLKKLVGDSIPIENEIVEKF